MKRLKWTLLALAIAIALGIFLLQSRDREASDKGEGAADSSKTQSDLTSQNPTPETPEIVADRRLNRRDDGSVDFLPAQAISLRIQPTNTVEENIAHIQSILGLYRFSFGENPVGVENFEITEQLIGKNPKKVYFISEESSALRGNELVDQWGTTYFFHPLSGQEMEIVSAGPDQVFWTEDDIRLPDTIESKP